MFQGLSNQVVVALLCVGMIVLSWVVIEGLYYLTQAYGPLVEASFPSQRR
jgi:hypothetical protein